MLQLLFRANAAVEKLTKSVSVFNEKGNYKRLPFLARISVSAGAKMSPVSGVLLTLSIKEPVVGLVRTFLGLAQEREK